MGHICLRDCSYNILAQLLLRRDHACEPRSLGAVQGQEDFPGGRIRPLHQDRSRQQGPPHDQDRRSRRR